MPLDFPLSPTNGQTYTSGGVTWIYDAAAGVWKNASPGAQGPQGSQGTQGTTGINGPQGVQGSQGAAGVSADIFNYSFSNNTAEPPTGSQIRLNHATQASATKMWVVDDTSDGWDIRNLVALVVAGDRLTLQDRTDNTRIQRFTVTGPPVPKTGYTEFPVVWLSGNATIAIGGIVFVVIRAGIAGPQGAQGSQGPQGTVAANQTLASITFVIDGGGSAITTGAKGDLAIPFNCTINEWTLLADQSGSIVVDVWKDTYANYPPVVGDSITASAKPTISTATKAQSATLTGWTTSISVGDTLRFNVNSITTIQRVTLSLAVTKTGVAAPTVATGAASSITAVAAVLNGTVSSNGAATTAVFQYGLTTAYDSAVAIAQGTLAAGAGGTAVSAATDVMLAANTLYHYRLVAQNSAGTTYGSDQTFTTIISDPHFANVSLLMNGGSGAVDSSANNHALTNIGSNTAIPAGGPFGTGALSITGYLSVASHATLIMGTGDFTWEGWVKIAAIPPTGWLLYNGDSSAFTPRAGLALAVAGNGGRAWYLNGNSTAAGTGVNPPTATWMYMAYSRISGTGRLFTGVLGDTNTVLAGSSIADANNYSLSPGLGIGGNTAGGNLIGASGAAELSNVRITKGVGRYSVAFPMPTAAFPAV